MSQQQPRKAGFCELFCGVCYFMFCGTREEIQKAVEMAPPEEFMQTYEEEKPKEPVEEIESSPISNDAKVSVSYKAEVAQQQRLSVSSPNLPILPRASFNRNQI